MHREHRGGGLLVTGALVLACAQWLAVPLQAAELQAPLTLHAAITRALELSPPQRLAEESVQLAESRRRVARADFLPQLGAEVSQNRQTINLATFGFTIPGFPNLIGPFSVFDARLRLSQRILDLSRASTLDSATVGIETARAQAQASRERIAGDVALSYIEVLSGEQAIEAAQSDLSLAEELLTLARDQRQAGVASGVDVARAETAVAQDRYALSQVRTRIAEARLRLQRAAVLPMDQPLQLDGHLDASPGMALTAEQALSEAREHRAELVALAAAARQADADLASARHRRLPTLSLYADYGVSANTPVQNEEETYRYGAVVSMPIYSGGALAAEIDSASHRLEQARLELEDLRAQVEQEVRLALATADENEEQLRAATATRDLATRELELARDRFANGVANNLDVVGAQTSLSRARAQYVAALALRQQARLNLAAARGRVQDFDLQ